MKRSIALVVLCAVVSFSAAAQDWTIEMIDDGTKPTVALDSNGDPHFAYIFELGVGWVRYAKWNSTTEDYDTETALDGNFYGPAAIAIDGNDNPGLNFHRHSPVPEQMYMYHDGISWSSEAIVSDNHDGWDNSIAFDSNDNPHTSTIDPGQLGGPGVEYASYDGASWTVEAIGSSDIIYWTTTSLALDDSDNAHISFYDNTTTDLMYAENTGGSWNITPVETAGDVGKFSSIALDSNGNPHITYFEDLGDSVGNVKYAAWNGASWDIEVVDQLTRVYIDLARMITSLELDADDTPHISYNDEAVVKYATYNGSSWDIETIVDVHNEETILGQSNSIAVADDGTVHVAYYELLTRSPLTGNAMHARRDPASMSIPCDEFDFFNAKCNANGAAQAMVRLLNSTQYAGQFIQMELDGTPYDVELITNGTHTIGRLQVPGAGMGMHTIELVDPAACYDPVTFTCQVNATARDDEFDAIWAEFDQLESLEETIPAETALIGNFPNPFNPSTTIRYSIGAETQVTLKIFNTLGEEVATLVNEFQTPGVRSVVWNGRNDFGGTVASGIYIYRLTADNLVLTEKMMFLK